MFVSSIHVEVSVSLSLINMSLVLAPINFSAKADTRFSLFEPIPSISKMKIENGQWHQGWRYSDRISARFL